MYRSLISIEYGEGGDAKLPDIIFMLVTFIISALPNDRIDFVAFALSLNDVLSVTTVTVFVFSVVLPPWQFIVANTVYVPLAMVTVIVDVPVPVIPVCSTISPPAFVNK